MSARIVCSGTRPSRYHSLRAISPPPSRPAHAIRMPSAPRRSAEVTAFFMARRNATRFWSWSATFSATSWASSSVDDLLDVEVDLLARPRLQLVLQLLHLGPLPADDDARPGRGDRDPRPVRRALDVDLGDARVIELILDVAPDLHILVQQICVALRREPAGAPRPRRTEAEADRMRLLAHLYVFSLDLEPLDVDPFDLAPFGFAALFGAALGVGRAAARPFLAAGGRGACTSAGAGAGGALSRGVGTGRTAPLVSSLTPIVRWLDRCRMEKARPIARGCTRFIEGPPSATA